MRLQLTRAGGDLDGARRLVSSCTSRRIGVFGARAVKTCRSQLAAVTSGAGRAAVECVVARSYEVDLVQPAVQLIALFKVASRWPLVDNPPVTEINHQLASPSVGRHYPGKLTGSTGCSSQNLAVQSIALPGASDDHRRNLTDHPRARLRSGTGPSAPHPTSPSPAAVRLPRCDINCTNAPWPDSALRRPG